jgi:hypothetical protein
MKRKRRKRASELPGPFAGFAEAAELLGVAPHTLWGYMKRVTPATQNFPEPIQNLAATPLWKASVLEQWGDTNLRKVKVKLASGKTETRFSLPAGRPPGT